MSTFLRAKASYRATSSWEANFLAIFQRLGRKRNVQGVFGSAMKDSRYDDVITEDELVCFGTTRAIDPT